VVGSLSALKSSLENAMDRIDHVYSIVIKAAPERVWQAIVDGDETVRYYFNTRVASDWTPGSPLTYAYPDGSVAADGSVIAIDPGRSVTMDFLPRWDPAMEGEGPIRMVWAVEPMEDGAASKLTVTSSLIPGSASEAEFSAGIVYIVSGLKTFVETGAPMVAA
jgi:uncharacterized protein YndB with AHSA1/START domain